MHRHQHGTRAVATLLGLLITCWSSMEAVAADLETVRTFNIAPQTLEAALIEFSAQADIQVIGATDTLADTLTKGVSGTLTSREALSALLKNTSVAFNPIGAHSVQIIPARAKTSSRIVSDARTLRLAGADPEQARYAQNAASASGATETQAAEDEQLEVVVRGVRFYQPSGGRAALKSDLPLLETPMSVSVVTSEQIEARAADSLEQAFRYSAGIYSMGGGANRRSTTGFVVRGFNVTGSAPLYVNGSKFPINSVTGAMEPYIFESVELLKGPASVLYGQTPPGGIINMVSKRSTRQPMGSVKLQAGSWDSKQLNADFGGPITDRVGYRLTGLVRDGGTMIDGIPDDRGVVAAALDFNPTEQTSFSLLGTYYDADTAYDNGKPFDGTVLPNVNGKISNELFIGEPGFDKFDQVGRTLGYLFEHRFNDTWKVRQNLLGFDYNIHFAGIEGGSATDALTHRLIGRFPYTRHDTDKGWSIDNQILGKFTPGRVEHTVLFGVDYSDRDFSRLQINGAVAPLDAYDPVYGSPVTLAASGARQKSANKQTGIYLQDHIKFDKRWVLLVGARWDDAKTESRNTSALGVVTTSKIDANAFTKRVGLLYLTENGIAPYISYSESFQPLGGANFAGNPFDPTEGVQYEAGIKFEPKSQNATFTFAAYKLTQQNNLTPDLNHPGFSAQAGEIEAKGVEAEGRISFGERLDVLAAYNHTKAEVTKSNGLDLGRKTASVPDNTASLWLDYHYRLNVQGELSLGAGARYVGESTNFLNTLTVPSYTDYDVSARYDLQKWRFALNVKNLLDKAYVAACTFACFYGDARNVTFSAQYTW